MILNSAASNDPEGRTDGNPIDRSLKLLREALSIVDAEGWPAEIGARLDHAICSIEELRNHAENKNIERSMS